MPNDMELDDVMGPEFSVRILNVCSNMGVKTVGQLRERLDEIDKWRGLGAKSIREIRSFYRHLDATQKNLLEDPEYLRYRLEDSIGTVEALTQDVQRTLTRIALKGRTNAETRNFLFLKLCSAADAIKQLPVIGEDA